MSALNTELPQVEIGLGGNLSIIGLHKGVALMKLERLAFARNDLAVKKIGERFHGQCLFTEDLTNKAPCFVFTVNAGMAIDNPTWFLRMVRKTLTGLVNEVDLLTR